jgi:hypothetical protein
MWRTLVVVGSVAVVGCTAQPSDDEPADPFFNQPLSHVEKDDRPTFQIDPSKPFQIEFGRGSGWHGLDTVKVNQDGLVVLHRLKKSADWERATLQLPDDALAKVLEQVDADHLLELHRAYHANVADGTQ